MQKVVITDEIRSAIVDRYVELINQYPAEDQPKYTVEVTSAVAAELGCTTNQVRAIVHKAKREDGTSVYVSKAAGAKTKTASTTTTESSKRRGKAESHADLVGAIEAFLPSSEVDHEIIAKLTGKSADYFTNILLKISELQA